MLKTLLYVFASILVIIIGLLVFARYSSESIIMPVEGAGISDYDQNSFGAPRVGHRHKGVDIFATKGTPVLAATRGIVVFTGVLSLGGNVELVLSPGLRFYYYAHLDTIATKKFKWVNQGDIIGTVGKTGNAKFTPAHLHFSISRLYFPFDRRFVNPVPVLNSVTK
jgi:murein DD-endopeptidase MepM/ murein hydrolase activator NlpD